MIQDSDSFNILIQPLIAQFNSFCNEYELIGIVQADHLCIKCSSSSVYEARRKEFENTSSFIYQSIISNRRISVIGLNDSIQTVIGDIKYIELSDQKPDGSQVDSVDHVEVVPISLSYQELVILLQNKKVEMKETIRPHHSTHDIKLPSGFTIKLSHEFLVDKIKRDEML